MVHYLQLLGGILLAAQASSARMDTETSHQLLSGGTINGVNEWMIENKRNANRWETHPLAGLMTSPKQKVAATAEAPLPPGTVTDTPPTNSGEKVYCFAQPRSHYDKRNKQQFCQRYWFNADHYKPGGPVILFDTGEQDADAAFRTGSKSFLAGWAEDLNGLLIILEHRYYGWSVPVEDFTTDNLRFLTVDEALEDTAEFIRHWEPPAGTLNLTDPSILRPDKTPWFYRGCSYAGARAAWMRKKYPELIYGSLACSATTLGIEPYWQYHNASMAYGPPDCVKALEESVKVIDSLLDKGGNASVEIKQQFGLEELEDDSDFAYTIVIWNSQNPPMGNFDVLCKGLMAPRPADEAPVVIAGTTLSAPLISYSDLVFAFTNNCREGGQAGELDISLCYANSINYPEWGNFTDLTNIWRLYAFQLCTQFGHTISAPPKGKPSIISKYVSYDYAHSRCHDWYQPGKYFKVPKKPNLKAVNKYGGLRIKTDRVAYVGGDLDPWRAATPMADNAQASTGSNPVDMITNATHCTDGSSNGPRFQEARDFQYDCIAKWVEEWKKEHTGHDHDHHHDQHHHGHGHGDERDEF